jgi:hypothetical protein
MVINVSPKGDDNFSGATEKPVKTLKKALELTREQTGKRTIQIGEGVYEDVCVELDDRDSGLSLLADGNAVLSGGRSISGWEKSKDGSYSTKLSKDIPADFRLITVNGRMCERSRIPETGTLKHRSVFNSVWLSTSGGGWDVKPTDEQKNTLEYDPADIEPDFDWQNADLTIFHRWDDSLTGICSHEADKNRFRLSTTPTHPPGGFECETYIIWNTQKGMTPGRWRVDKSEQKLYYMPLDGEDMTSAQVIVPLRQTIINILGEVKDFLIDGLKFMITSSPATACGFGTMDLPGAINSTAILENCEFKNLSFTAMSGWGINLISNNKPKNLGSEEIMDCGLVGNNNVTVENCEVFDTGGGGVQIFGNTKCLIKCNKIISVGKLYYSAVGISATNCDIIENELSDLPYSGIVSGVGKGPIVRGNKINGAVKVLKDGAGIYVTFSRDGVLKDNFVENVPSESHASQRHGLYLDEQANGWVVEGNITSNCPSALLSHMNYKGGNTIRNNVFTCHSGDMTVALLRCEDHKLTDNTFHAAGAVTFSGGKGTITEFESNLIYSAAGKVNEQNVSYDYEWSEPVAFTPDSKRLPLG